MDKGTYFKVVFLLISDLRDQRAELLLGAPEIDSFVPLKRQQFLSMILGTTQKTRQDVAHWRFWKINLYFCLLTLHESFKIIFLLNAQITDGKKRRLVLSVISSIFFKKFLNESWDWIQFHNNFFCLNSKFVSPTFKDTIFGGLRRKRRGLVNWFLIGAFRKFLVAFFLLKGKKSDQNPNWKDKSVNIIKVKNPKKIKFFYE